MKTNNNHNSLPSCRFGETLVTVLYGEADATETENFYLHLDRCGDCSAELAAFGSLRNSINDWREADFRPLSATEIYLPQEKPNEFAPETAKIGWLDSIRAFFAQPKLNWQLTAAGFAIIFFAGLLTIVFISQNSRQQSEVVTAPPIPAASATPEITLSAATLPKTPNTVETETPISNKTQTVNARKPDSIRIADKSAKQNKVNAAVNRNTLKQRTVVVKQPSQSFADINILPDETEDSSPRLTDLLEEIEPSI